MGLPVFYAMIKDSKDLADKMEKMYLLTAEERNLMGKKGRQKMIKEFDKKIVINNYLDAIDEVLNVKDFNFSTQFQTLTQGN